LKKCLEDCDKTTADIIFKCYISWLSEFLLNLGINSEEIKGHENSIKLLNCPWIEENDTSPMFCLICRAIVIRSFTWTEIKGHVEQKNCMADGAGECVFKFLHLNC
ncbi:MAG: methanogen output domain 1-containing protein, partial [Methanobacterium paludis]|nr:methanogen output domain 1-containing protein [Methanobacterium paludis]